MKHFNNYFFAVFLACNLTTSTHLYSMDSCCFAEMGDASCATEQTEEARIESFGQTPFSLPLASAIFPIELKINYNFFDTPWFMIQTLQLTSTAISQLIEQRKTCNDVWHETIEPYFKGNRDVFVTITSIKLALICWVNGTIEWICDEPVILRHPLKERLYYKGVSEEEATLCAQWFLYKINESFSLEEPNRMAQLFE